MLLSHRPGEGSPPTKNDGKIIYLCKGDFLPFESLFVYCVKAGVLVCVIGVGRTEIGISEMFDGSLLLYFVIHRS